MRVDDYIEALVREIQTHGVTDWTIDRQHNHPRLSFAWDGGTIVHTMPGSPSDAYRGVQNNLSELRQRMGVKRIISKSSAAPKKRATKTVVSLAGLSSFTVKENPLLALSAMKDRINAALTEAKWLGRYAYYGGQSGVAPTDYAPHLAEMFMTGWYDGVWER